MNKIKYNIKKWQFELFPPKKQALIVDFIDYQKRPEDMQQVEIPKIIWLFWYSEQPNHLVELCIIQLKKMCPDYEIHILNFDMIEQFIDPLPLKLQTLPIANISDYIRLALLKKYGGIYMDASVFLTEPLDWVMEKIINHDAFVLYTDDCTTNMNYPIIETWFIFAPKNSVFIQQWFEEYQRCIMSENPDLYYVHLLDNKEFIQNLPNVDYLKCYVSAMVILRKYKFNLLIARSGSTGHYYNYQYMMKPEYIAILLLKKSKNKITTPKMIKFTQDTRWYVERYLKKGKYTENSLLGKLLIKNSKLDIINEH